MARYAIRPYIYHRLGVLWSSVTYEILASTLVSVTILILVN